MISLLQSFVSLLAMPRLLASASLMGRSARQVVDVCSIRGFFELRSRATGGLEAPRSAWRSSVPGHHLAAVLAFRRRRQDFATADEAFDLERPTEDSTRPVEDRWNTTGGA